MMYDDLELPPAWTPAEVRQEAEATMSLGSPVAHGLVIRSMLGHYAQLLEAAVR